MYSNKLIHETSPYLLQHAHNPVEWYPWGEEALQKAKAENKPILVSIGYAACHWCHVMERESFEDESTAELMNTYFINIKIDREERPDLDHIYMDAVQSMTGSGGWPLNVFLTSECKPFFGGTYFPPVEAFNRKSWKEILMLVQNAYQEKSNEIKSQADKLTEHLIIANSFGLDKQTASGSDAVFAKENVEIIAANILAQADKEWGGFGNAPKFPQTFSIQFLLRHYHFTKDKNALHQALLSLDKMVAGGMYDQIGGGFSRYSTDIKWFAPHFEKMLYDNALLIGVLSEAYQLTKKELYGATIHQTMQFIEREMLSEENGFYSALDADSEGAEGKFYTWTWKELEATGIETTSVAEYFHCSPEGNWEHGRNILIREIHQPLPNNSIKTAKEKMLAVL
ncbi:MAG: thioredoxin domain-containing protein, partial [Bacteroidota bacterium]|nr:thioredoxin domain-containing protein [Bacteroidota bacterium]